MSMMGGRMPQGSADVGRTVAEFPTYEAAQKAVSALVAGDVPAREIAIVGQNLRSVERVTGRLGYAAAARSGAVNGLLLGLLFSAIFVLGTPAAPIQAFVGVMFIGIAVGMLLSIITFSVVRRRRDFASVMQVVADHYEVTVADSSVHRAREILGRAPSAPAQPVPPRTVVAAPVAPTPTPDAPVAAAPPRYGERVPPASEQPTAPAPAPAPPTAPPAPPTAPTPESSAAPQQADAPGEPEPRGEDGPAADSPDPSPTPADGSAPRPPA
ncbi:general stress protein [Microbacterium sp. CJ88]|uniref:general stress protein n=1 Tax=Microbacterium sp. CJ88 TaxID=3445672 RepID=UPI003F6591CE